MGDAGALFLGLAHGRLDHGHRRPAHRSDQRRDLFLLRPAVHPVLHSGGAHRGHDLRVHPAHRPGTRFHTPDKKHIHHRLLHLGHGPRRSVIILWAWTAILSASSCSPSSCTRSTPSSPSGRPPWGWACTPSSTRGCGRGTVTARTRVNLGRPQLAGGGRVQPRSSGFPKVLTVRTHLGRRCDDDGCVPRPPRLVRLPPSRPVGRRTPARHAPRKGTAVA